MQKTIKTIVNVNDYAEKLPNGQGMVITGIDSSKREVFIAIAKKEDKAYVEECPTKEIARFFLQQLFDNKAILAGVYSK